MAGRTASVANTADTDAASAPAHPQQLVKQTRFESAEDVDDSITDEDHTKSSSNSPQKQASQSSQKTEGWIAPAIVHNAPLSRIGSQTPDFELTHAFATHDPAARTPVHHAGDRSMAMEAAATLLLNLPRIRALFDHAETHKCEKPKGTCWVKALRDLYHQVTAPNFSGNTNALNTPFRASTKDVENSYSYKVTLEMAFDSILSGLAKCLPDEIIGSFECTRMTIATCPNGCTPSHGEEGAARMLLLPAGPGDLYSTVNETLFGCVYERDADVCSDCHEPYGKIFNNKLLTVGNYMLMLKDVKARGTNMHTPFYLDIKQRVQPKSDADQETTVDRFAYLTGVIEEVEMKPWPSHTNVYVRSGHQWTAYNLHSERAAGPGASARKNPAAEIAVLEIPSPRVLLYSFIDNAESISEVREVKEKFTQGGFLWPTQQAAAIETFHGWAGGREIPFPQFVHIELPENDVRHYKNIPNSKRTLADLPADALALNTQKDFPKKAKLLEDALLRYALRIDIFADSQDDRHRDMPAPLTGVSATVADAIRQDIHDFKKDPAGMPLDKRQLYTDMDQLLEGHDHLFELSNDTQWAVWIKAALKAVADQRNSIHSKVKEIKTILDTEIENSARPRELLITARFLIDWPVVTAKWIPGEFDVDRPGPDPASWQGILSKDGLGARLMILVLRVILWGKDHAEEWQMTAEKKHPIIKTAQPTVAMRTRIAKITPSMLALALVMVELHIRKQTKFAVKQTFDRELGDHGDWEKWFTVQIYDKARRYFFAIWNHQAFVSVRRYLNSKVFPTPEDMQRMSQGKISKRHHTEDADWEYFSTMSFADGQKARATKAEQLRQRAEQDEARAKQEEKEAEEQEAKEAAEALEKKEKKRKRAPAGTGGSSSTGNKKKKGDE